jgi:hypothetical protein
MTRDATSTILSVEAIRHRLRQLGVTEPAAAGILVREYEDGSSLIAARDIEAEEAVERFTTLWVADL